MTSRSIINILTIAYYMLNALCSCGQVRSTKNGQLTKIKNSIQFDTSKTAIISFDQKSNYPFNNSYTPATLTSEDIHNIESLLIKCVFDYNKSLDKNHKQWAIDLINGNYRKQLIIAKNKKGEKEVWVNCFCDTWNSNRWKTEIMIIEDGGNCFFNFKINLASQNIYDFGVNGLG